MLCIRFWLLFCLCFIGSLTYANDSSSKIIRSHGIAMYGEPKYPSDFTHFDYVNPYAPKGGTFRTGATGTYNSFNPWIDKGTAAGSGAHESLMTSSDDEAFTYYCLICEQIEYPEDRSWITFFLRSEARWHDGRPITPEDVVWSFNTLVEKGDPFWRVYYSDVNEVVKTGSNQVQFKFKLAGNRELPMIVSSFPILPKHYWEADGRDFSKTTLEPPLGSGPYRITDFEEGRYIVQERVQDYWGSHLAVNQGKNNFDSLRTRYFRDRIPLRLALKSGDLDYYFENTAKSWATEFDIPSVRSGSLVRETVYHSSPQGMQAFVMNLRRPQFMDRNIRKAIILAFDFGWTNQKIFYNQYIRSESFFSNSELASSGIPQGRELEILNTYRDRLPSEIFHKPFVLRETDSQGWPRENLLEALELISQSDYEIVDGKLLNPEGQPVRVEFLLYSASFERIVLPYIANLRRLGIDMSVRLVDRSQYINRLRAFDYDMIVSGWGQSESPGNEQRNYWSCAAAEQPSSRNQSGICDPVVDELIEKLVVADDREELIAITRALDRVLLWHNFVVPNWHIAADRILWWDKYDRPAIPLRHGVSTNRWWYDEEKDRNLQATLEGGSIAQNDVSSSSATRPTGWRLTLLVGVIVGGLIIIRSRMKHRKKGAD
ncbi:MAG: extracellular solute-binding protein [Gammaproteobacteria bacterium]|nr:extracellular solute-binding protein [Gammaproteobacteria bacterium]